MFLGYCLSDIGSSEILLILLLQGLENSLADRAHPSVSTALRHAAKARPVELSSVFCAA